jgi:hypothetical protein
LTPLPFPETESFRRSIGEWNIGLAKGLLVTDSCFEAPGKAVLGAITPPSEGHLVQLPDAFLREFPMAAPAPDSGLPFPQPETRRGYIATWDEICLALPLVSQELFEPSGDNIPLLCLVLLLWVSDGTLSRLSSIPDCVQGRRAQSLTRWVATEPAAQSQIPAGAPSPISGIQRFRKRHEQLASVPLPSTAVHASQRRWLGCRQAGHQ